MAPPAVISNNASVIASRPAVVREIGIVVRLSELRGP
jgi:hypothetical protein